MKINIEAWEIRQKIHSILGVRVILDRDLAGLYQVETKALNQAARRNLDRFPSDFILHLNPSEMESLRSQSVTLEAGRGKHSKYAALAFTEQGIAMLSSVLRSPQAVQVNIEIMRAFVRTRQVLGNHQELAIKLELLEGKYDKQFRIVFQAIRQMMGMGVPAHRRIKGLEKS